MYEQVYITIEKDNLLETVQQMKNQGYRLAQICVTKLDKFAYLYSFSMGNTLTNLCFSDDFDEPVPSVSWLYSYAFIYENEMKDLFGTIITDMNIDFKGNLYKTSVKTPFNPVENEDSTQ